MDCSFNKDILQYPWFLKYLQEEYPFHHQILTTLIIPGTRRLFSTIEFDEVFNNENFPGWQDVFDQLREDFRRNYIKYYSLKTIIFSEESFSHVFKWKKNINNYSFDFSNFESSSGSTETGVYKCVFFDEVEKALKELEWEIIPEFYKNVLVPWYLQSIDSLQLETSVFWKPRPSTDPIIYLRFHLIEPIYTKLGLLVNFLDYDIKTYVNKYLSGYIIPLKNINIIRRMLQQFDLNECKNLNQILNNIISLNTQDNIDILKEEIHNIQTSYVITTKQEKQYFDTLVQFIKESLEILVNCNLDIENMLITSNEDQNYLDCSVNYLVNRHTLHRENYLHHLIYNFIVNPETIQDNKIFKLYSKSVQDHLLRHPDNIYILCVFLEQVRRIVNI